MPDWNPDREGHHNHRWIVHNATRDRDFKGVHAGGKNMLFNDEGRFMVKDEKIASEIRKEHPRAVTVTRVRWPHASDKGHNYFFRCPAMPWHKREEDED